MVGKLFRVEGSLVAEFISPPKVYTFSFIVGNIIPKSVKCIHSATKVLRALGFKVCGSFRKLGVPYFGVLRIRILLFGVLY